MLNVPREAKDYYECRPLKEISGRVKLKPRSRHPALVVLAHFSNRLQLLNYPFNRKERGMYFDALRAIGGKRVLICPNCCQYARFMPTEKSGKIKAWFCACSYQDHHQNGLKKGD